MGRAVFLTGEPGVGKTTVLLKAIQIIQAEGFKVGGFVSQEVRVGGARVGFQLLDLSRSLRGWLAHVQQPQGPRVGKYRVNLEDLDRVGTAALESALSDREVRFVAVDEVGPMELYSEPLRRAVSKALEGPKPVVGVIHRRAKGPFVEAIRRSPNVEVLEVTYENRELLPARVAERVLGWLKPFSGA